MVQAVTSRAATDSAFRAKVDAAALRVLTVKAGDGLLAPRPPVDGSLGSSTVVALQRWLGITRTGVFDTATIRALQARIGMTVVGVWGPNSMAAMQSYLGISRDGATYWNARTVSQLQRYLATQL
jgi:beta-N-acetylhexosaminidase